MDKKRIKTELMVHDLKNPLAVIDAGINSLLFRTEKYGALTEKQLKVLHRALRNVKIAKGLVNDILEVGKSSEGIISENNFYIHEFVKISLTEVFDVTDHSLAEMIRDSGAISDLKTVLKGKGIVLNMDEGLWSEEICLDITKLRQILRNLLSNALKYRIKTVEIEISKDSESLYISVTDDGEGIKEEYHKKIFECYFQVDDERDFCVRGHGLGLAGVLILVEDMGGKMTLESDEGKGAKFSVLIPLRCR